jgi:GNAT superfamily N-acetyltransferase
MTNPAPARPQYDETHHRIRACVDGEVIGEALLAHLDGTTAAGSVEVQPAWRRRGTGAQLLQRLRRAAAAAGYEELVLLATLDGEGAVAFLAACGMRARIRFTADGLLIRLALPAAGDARPAA